MKTILAWLLGFGGSVLRFYAPVLRTVAQSGMADLLPVAVDIVESLEDSTRSPQQKRDVAVARLRDVAVHSGISATTELLNFTVESALMNLRKGGK